MLSNELKEQLRPTQLNDKELHTINGGYREINTRTIYSRSVRWEEVDIRFQEAPASRMAATPTRSNSALELRMLSVGFTQP